MRRDRRGPLGSGRTTSVDPLATFLCERRSDTPIPLLVHPRAMSSTAIRNAVRLIVLGSMVVAAATNDVAFTGIGWVDAVWAALFVGLASAASSRARRNSWLWMSGIATAAAIGSWWAVLACLALLISLVNTLTTRRDRPSGASIGALTGLTLLHLPSHGMSGLEVLVAIVAVAPVIATGYQESPGFVRKQSRRFALIAVGALAAATIAAIAAVLIARPTLEQAVDGSRTGLDEVRAGDPARSAVTLREASKDFAQAERDLTNIWMAPARAVPVIGTQVDALATAATSGRQVTQAAAKIASVAPYRSLKADGGTIDVDALTRMREPVREMLATVDQASAPAAALRSAWLLPPIDDGISALLDELGSARDELQTADAILTAAPGLLGDEGEQNYLLLFTSPAETRNLGGFTGSYGLLSADGGTVELKESGSTGRFMTDQGVDPSTVTLQGTDEFIARYAHYQPNRFLQNLTVSPDMATTAELAASIYGQATGTRIDGVIVVDPFAIAAILKLTGPVEVEGIDQPLTADNAATYLLHGQYEEFDDETEVRRDALEAAGDAAFRALTTRDLPGPTAVAAALGPASSDKHLMFYPFDDEARTMTDLLGITGEFKPTAGADFLSVRMADYQANKLDYFLRRSISYDASFDPASGRVRSTVTIEVRNQAPATGLPSYVTGPATNLAPGTAQVHISVYTPLAASSAMLDGVPWPLESQRELGAKTFGGILTIPPGASTTLTIELDGAVTAGPDYILEVLSQPLAHPDDLAVNVTSGSDGWVIASSDLASRPDGSVGMAMTPTTGDVRFLTTFEPD